MVFELSGVQFWSEIILVISNRPRAASSFHFEITRMISDHIALHSVQLPLQKTEKGNLKKRASVKALLIARSEHTLGTRPETLLRNVGLNVSIVV